jgi:signal transduction histidine kinase
MGSREEQAMNRDFAQTSTGAITWGPNLEHKLAELSEEFASGTGRFRLFVIGRTAALHPAIQQQISLIVREAELNAFRHSAATSIETEIEYLSNKVRVVVRDNGCGIDQKSLQLADDSRCGLLGMRERAESIGAQLRIRSRRGAGTEVEVSVPSFVAMNGCSLDSRKLPKVQLSQPEWESVAN